MDDQNTFQCERFDKAVVKKAELTPEGYLKADAVVTRTGVFTYMNQDGTVRKELRHPDDVFMADSLDSMKMRPITDGHPEAKLVNSDNAKDLTVGYTGENVQADGQYLVTSLLVTNKDAVANVTSKKRTELSLGYTVDLKKEDGIYGGERYDFRQTNIRYNHLALVDRARAGNVARIHLDSADSARMIATDNDYFSNFNLIKENNMTEEKYSLVTLDGIEYKSSPEVANAYKKVAAELSELKANLDSITEEKEAANKAKVEAEEKLDEMMGSREDMIRKAIKERVKLLQEVLMLMGGEMEGEAYDAYKGKMDEMSNEELMKSVVAHKCPKANLDEADSVYIKARFDHLLETFEPKKEEASSIASQREKVAPKLDSKPKNTAMDARERMLERMRNSYKSNKENK
jgi:hypothetical protein